MVIVLLVLLAAGGYCGWRVVQRASAPIEVEVATVTERAAGTQAAVLNASGYVTARRRATVSSKITGKVVEVNVEEGMAVREGQILARLDDVDAQGGAGAGRGAGRSRAAQPCARTKCGCDEAQVDAQARWRMLVKDGFATQAEVDAAKARWIRIDARIVVAPRAGEGRRAAGRARSRPNLDNTIIRAPFSGVAISKDAQPGEMVSPVSAGGGFTRTGICTIVDMRSLEIEVDVNESYINRVKPDQGVTAVLDAYPDWQIPAHVITMVPTADRQKATVLVRIGIREARSAHPAGHGREGHVPARRRRRASAPAQRSRSTLVPKAAIKTEGTQTIVVRRRQRRRRRAARREDRRHRRRPAWRCWPGSARANASWSRRRRRWRRGCR